MDAETLAGEVVGRASDTGLMLDFDGVLAPIIDDPAASQLLPGTDALLAELAGSLRLVAVISGRPLTFLLERVTAPGVELIGSYGAEVLHRGQPTVHPGVAEHLQAVSRADSLLRAAVSTREGLFVETKSVSVAVHWRNAPDRAAAELERACELLGIAALHVLPFADSGAHRGPWARGTLGAAAHEDAVARVARVVEAEDAGALVHYDPRGIYGHVDHVRVHETGAAVARRLGVASYEATVDADALRRGPRHVLQQAAGDSLDVGVPAGGIGLTLHARPQELLAKMAAMAAHSSQIGPEYLDAAAFAGAYGREWFVRRGAASVLDRVLADTPEDVAPRRRVPQPAGTAA